MDLNGGYRPVVMILVLVIYNKHCPQYNSGGNVTLYCIVFWL